MKKLVLVIAVLCFFQHSFSQDLNIKKNTISYEIGMWNRGLMGLSYHRHLVVSDFACVSLGGGAGVGIGWQNGSWFGTFERNFYGFGDVSFNLGNEEVMFMLGFEGKYVDLYAGGHYNGFGATPYVGVTTGFSDFTFQLRAGVLVCGENFDKVLPSTGLSFGYSF
ncbi:MAG: hypothetical protein ABJG68_03275 [Crocinitomicaceae bacterium]